MGVFDGTTKCGLRDWRAAPAFAAVATPRQPRRVVIDRHGQTPAGARVLVLENDHSSAVLEWITRAPAGGFTVSLWAKSSDPGSGNRYLIVKGAQGSSAGTYSLYTAGGQAVPTWLGRVRAQTRTLFGSSSVGESGQHGPDVSADLQLHRGGACRLCRDCGDGRRNAGHPDPRSLRAVHRV